MADMPTVVRATNYREWTISQRAFRLGKLMGQGKAFSTDEICEMLGYSQENSVYSLFGALIDEDIRRGPDGKWRLYEEW